MKPDAVAATERVLGANAENWQVVMSRGYALGDRWLVALDDGRSVFAKRAISEPTAESLRDEHDVYSALEEPFLPRFLGWDDAALPLLILEDLSGANWPPPWTTASVDAVLLALENVAHATPPPGLPRLDQDPPASWDAVADDPEPFLELGVRSRAWLDACLPALLDASRPSLLEGDSLVHFDVRSDNLCLRDGEALLVDWNLAAVGNPAFDVAFWLPSLALERGPGPTELARAMPAVEGFAAFVAGFFAARAGLPAPPAAPTVRAFQLAQLEIALPWASGVLDLPF